MQTDRYIPKGYAEHAGETCQYCRRKPAQWHMMGNEKVCAHCGTRVLVSRSPVKAVLGKRAAQG